MKNNKYSTFFYVILAILILLSAIYILFIYKTDYLKIFVVYYKPAPLIKTEIFEPIQGGRSISNSPSRAGTFTQKEISWLKENIGNLKKGQKLFIVDLETVSIFPPQNLLRVVSDKQKYEKTPFLYLISSYVRNKSLDFASKNLTYLDKKRKGSWQIYCFQKG